jgi:hypothetical protein
MLDNEVTQKKFQTKRKKKKDAEESRRMRRLLTYIHVENYSTIK